ncbi:acyltransferase family protein [Marisediminicola sp. LYQ85]|uniref:acyltransferase family protein n=1 Tax=Marisediminicola sp. LYQ85 TaxID=3391062 RepID=UPI003983AC29
MGETSRAMRLDSLTSLRFFAALLVFLRHLVPALQDANATLAASLLLHANIGVSFFFILSGFVLAWSQRDGDTKARFYQRRFARVWPSHAVTWLIALTLLLALGEPVNPLTAVGNLLLLQSWVPDQAVFLSINSVSWSLSCELLFYLTFPLLFSTFRRLRDRDLYVVLIGSVVAIFTVAYFSTLLDLQSAIWLTEYFPVARLPEFAIGVSAAVLVSRGAIPRIPLGVGVATALLGYASASIPGKVAFLPQEIGFVAMTVLPLTVLIVAAAQFDISGGNSLLHARVLVVLGQWSFAFYLVHLLVIEAATRLGLFGDSLVTVALAGSVSFIVSTFAAGVLHKAVERPAEKRLRPAETPPRAQHTSLA